MGCLLERPARLLDQVVGIEVKGLTDGQQLDDVDPPRPSLRLRDVRLRLAEPVR